MSVRARRLVWLAAVPLSVVLAVSGLAADVSTAAPGRVAGVSRTVREPGQVPIPQRYLAQQPSWSTCDFNDVIQEEVPTAHETRCARVRVPMDWRHPDAHPDISLAIAYSKASGTSLGMLTSNPGGPGAEGLTLTAALGISKPAMFAQYDLLGFDPRGFGDSTNVQCVTTQSKIDRLGSVADRRVRSKRAHVVEVAEARLLAEACASSELSQFINTQQTVYDLDFLRTLLRSSKLSYIGYSYGTWLGAWYADTYPDRVGRFILDSNMAWTGTMYANQASQAFSFQRRRDQMLYPWIARHNRLYGLGGSSAAVGHRYEVVRARLANLARRGVEGADPALLDYVLAESIYADEDFPLAAETLVVLDEITSQPLNTRRLLRLRQLVRAHALGAPFAVQRAAGLFRGRAASGHRTDARVVLNGTAGEIVSCNDTPASGNIARLLRRADLDAHRFPFIGYVNTVPACSYWRFRQNPRVLNLPGAPRILMFQSEGDPATSYEGSLTAHRKTPTHTRFVAVDNEGQHGLYIDGPSVCVEAAGDAYLFSGRLPAKDQVCGTSPLPGDSKVYRLDGPVDGHSYRLDVRSRPRPRVHRPNQMLERIRRDVARRSFP